MGVDADVARLVEAAGGLVIQPRARRWVHLPVCVLDAVFSINSRYTSVVTVCDRYAQHQNLEPYLVAAAEADAVIGSSDEQPVEALAVLGRELGAERLAGEVWCNRGRTSTRGGVLKAEAAVRYADILAASGVHALSDVAALLGDPGWLQVVEGRLRAVPGNGAHDVRLGYLWMLSGDDHHVKPDRMVLRWLCTHLHRDVRVPAARDLLAAAASQVGCTLWELDHAIWTTQRNARGRRNAAAQLGAPGATA